MVKSIEDALPLFAACFHETTISAVFSCIDFDSVSLFFYKQLINWLHLIL